jgi:Holliday junction resolvase
LNRNYTRGRAREWDVQEHYERRGYVTVRGAGSKGCDVVALKAGFPVEWVEVKASKTPWSSFPPAERKAFLDAAERAGAKPVLVWWPSDRLGPRWLFPDAWPTIKDA